MGKMVKSIEKSITKKIENDATVVLLEILGILGVENIIKTFREAGKLEEGETGEELVKDKGYFVINYLFQNVRQIQPQLEELIDIFIEDDVNILEGIGLLKEDEKVVSFFTKSLGEVMKSV